MLFKTFGCVLNSWRFCWTEIRCSDVLKKQKASAECSPVYKTVFGHTSLKQIRIEKHSLFN
jgi:hypothetical protein